MVGPEARLALASGFYVLGAGGLLGLLAGAILLGVLASLARLNASREIAR